MLATEVSDALPASPVETEPTGIAAKGAVLWWAALGTGAFATILWCLGNWILFNWKPAPVPATPLAAGQAHFLLAVQIVSPLFPVIFGWIYIVRPWLRDRRLSWDGVFMLACATVLLQDPINNYFKFTFSYNTHLFNRSSWAPYLPGWEAKGLENFAEPLLFIAPLCFTSFFLMSVIGCSALDWLRARLPNLSFASHCVLLYAGLFVWDFMFEFWMVPSGLFTFNSVYGPFSLWVGEWYQFPLYEIAGVALLNLFLTLLRYRRDEHGHSFPERGIDAMPVSGAPQTFVRWLALTGAVQLISLTCFFVPYNWMAMKATSFPTMPERFTYGMCGSGPGAHYPCSTAADPDPRK